VNTPLYTERFAEVVNKAGSATYTVPAGKRAIVMSLVAVSLVAGGMGASVVVSGGRLLAWLAFTGQNVGGAQVDLRQPVYAGEQLVLNTTAVGYATVSGYLLTAPGP
jgi:hypothetical protein